MKVFLSVIGPAAYRVLKNILKPDLSKNKDYKTLTEKLTSHYHPIPIVISERFEFLKRNQKEREKVNNCMVAVKKLWTDCKFGIFLQNAL